MEAEQAVEVLKALADPTRLRLVGLLHEHGTLCVCELEQVLALPQYTVSRHLGVLRRAGLVAGARDGARMDYRIRPDLAEPLRELLASTVAVTDDSAEARGDRQAARQVRPEAACRAAGG